MEVSRQQVAEYFVVAGVPHKNPVPVKPDFGHNEESKALEPITSILLICPDREQVPPDFTCIDKTVLGHSADLNCGSVGLKRPRMYLCIQRDRRRDQLIRNIDVIDTENELPSGYQAIVGVPSERGANRSGTDNKIIITYQPVSRSAYNKFVVTDVCVILKNKGEMPPRGYFMIPLRLNPKIFSNDAYICYKRSLNKPPLLMYRPVVLTRYPQSDYPACPFPNDVASFCLPNHGTVEWWKESPPNSQIPDPTFITFVLPARDVNTHKVYGATLIFYEPYQATELSQEQKASLGIPLSGHKTNQQRVYVSKSICLLSRTPFFHGFRTFLQYIYGMVKHGSHDVPVERYIVYLLRKTPLPYNTCSVLQKLSPNKSMFLHHFHNHPLPKSAASFFYLLNKMGTKNCMKILLLALMEQKILVCSAEPHINTAVVEAISMMIFPLHWQYPYLPSCPLNMSSVVISRSPFLVGIDTEYFDKLDCPIDVTCIDLNAKHVAGTQNFRLPETPAKQLKLELKKLKVKVRDLLRCKVTSTPLRKRKERILDVEIQQAFLRFMAEIFNGDFRYTAEETINSGLVFNSNAFVKSMDRSCRDFYRQLTMTTQFKEFVAWNDNVSEKHFFFKCIERINYSDCRETVQLIKAPEIEKTKLVRPPQPIPFSIPIGAAAPIYNYNGIFQLQQNLLVSSEVSSTSGASNFVEFYNFTRMDTDEEKSCAVTSEKNKMCDWWNNISLEINVNSFEKTDNAESGNDCGRDENGASRLSEESWGKKILSTCYKIWFFLLPSHMKDATTVKSASLQLALKMLVQMRISCGGILLDKETYEILLRLCRTYGKISLALQILLEMKRSGVQPNRFIEYIFEQATYIEDHSYEVPVQCLNGENSNVGEEENDDFIQWWKDASEFYLEKLVSTALLNESKQEIVDEVNNEPSYCPPVTAEIIMTTNSKCENCGELLFDEEIMAGWVPEDENARTRCPHCEQLTVAVLRVTLIDYRLLPLPCKDAGINRGTKLVSYLSPLKVQEKLKRCEDLCGPEFTLNEHFLNEYYTIYWNMVWFFERAKLPNFLTKLCMNTQKGFPELQDPMGTPSWLTDEKPNIVVRCKWDDVSFHQEKGVPLYVFWLNERENKRSPEVFQPTSNVDSDLVELMNCLISATRRNKLVEEFHKLVEFNFQKLIYIENSRYISAYRDLLFFLLVAAPQCSIDKERIQSFNREYRKVLSKYLSCPEYSHKIENRDAPPNEKALSCQELFTQLELDMN